MPTEPPPVTLFQAVKRAADVVDPDDEDAVIGDFERAFEDDDEPIRAVDDVEERVGEVLADLDPATNNGALSIAGAIVVYLAFRRDELDAEPAELIRLAARSEWRGDVPEPVLEWLADTGITL
jgi:hypothetical protein